MSDLDDEELEATRRLNGVAKKSNIERTDINVGNIEKDIKRCEQLIKPEHANWIGISNQLAIAHVVDRVKELEEETDELKQALARNIAKNFASSMKESAKSKDDLEMLNKGWQIELKKKNKQIDLMAEYIVSLDIEEDICVKTGRLNECDSIALGECENCIKQYFKELAERKSKE